MIPGVVANETGRAETWCVEETAVVAHQGLDGPVPCPAGAWTELQTMTLPERCWKGRPEQVRVL